MTDTGAGTPLDTLLDSLAITAPSDLSSESLFYRDGWEDALNAVRNAARSRPATDPACPYCAAWHAIDHNADNAGRKR